MSSQRSLEASFSTHPAARTTYARRRPIRSHALALTVLLGLFQKAAAAGEVPETYILPAGGTQLTGTPIKAAASAIINFTERAQVDAAKPKYTGPLQPWRVYPNPEKAEAAEEGYTEPEMPYTGPAPRPLTGAPTPLLASPSPSANFAGMNDVIKVGSGGAIVIPPDTDGAVGLTKILVGVNNNYQILDKATGAQLSAVSTDTFWAGLGGTGLFDPKTVYDPINDRWIICILSDAQAANASILIGVSQTSDPSGSYFAFRVDADATNLNWVDFPMVGFNKNWVAINVNFIVTATSAFVAGHCLVLDYAQLRANTLSGTTFTGTGFCSSPSATYSSTENTLYVPTHLSSAGASYRLDTITGTPAAPVYTVGATKTRTGGGWTQPSGQILPQAAPLSGASSCGATPCRLETQDSQIRATSVFRGGFVYYTQTIGLPSGGLTRTAAQWTKLDAVTGNFSDGGRVDDPTATATNGGKWHAYPHIAVNQFGDMLMGFSQFASNQYPSAGYTFHSRTDGAGVMNNPLIYKTGLDYYHKDFASGRNRFGDYSKAQVDPSNDADLWVLNEYADTRTGTDDGGTGSNSSRWATWWAKVSVSPTEVTMAGLAAERYPDGVAVRWQTGMEVRNLGFNVYREDGGARTQLNPSLLAGSALVVGPNTSLLAGRSYGWWDPTAKSATSYWVEELDLSGKSVWHGPIRPSTTTGPKPDPRKSAILNLIGTPPGPGGTRVVERRAAIPAARSDLQAAPAAGVRIAIRDEGWYRISSTQLAAAGLGTRTDPANLQLFVDGTEVPIQVKPSFRLGAYDVELYATGLDSPFGDLRSYFLVAGSAPGKRIKVRSDRGGAPAPDPSFLQTVERRDRTVYFTRLLNGDGENFFGPLVGGAAVQQPVQLTHVDPAASQPALLEVALQGVTVSDHQVEVLVNGALAGEISFSGMSTGTLRTSVPLRFLREGTNTITLNRLGGALDYSLVDRVRLSYPHLFVADDDRLTVPALGGATLVIGGFSGPDVRIADVTDPAAVVEVRASSVEVSKDGSYVATVQAPGVGDRTLLAFRDSTARQPASIAAYQPTDWKLETHGADLLVLTRKAYFASLEPLKQLRQKQGTKVELVDVLDVYDEFSFGQKTPRAVKDFVSWATSRWTLKPRFLLFAGGASYDPKGYLGNGALDEVPTRLIDTAQMETASDDWFADVSGGGVPALAVGRLPFRTAEEAAIMVGKLVAYDSSAPARRLVLVSDVSDTYDFLGASASLLPGLPSDLTVQTIDRASLDPISAKAQLLAAINGGPLLVNYFGHGSTDLWRGSLLTDADAAALTNDRLPVFLLMTCLNGYFPEGALDSLGVALLKSPHGGVAAWASSGLVEPDSQLLMDRALYRLLFTPGASLTLGEATARAKVGINDPDVKRTWILLGDPTLRLR